MAKRRAKGRGGARAGSGQPAVYRPKTEAVAFLPSDEGAQLLGMVRDRAERSYSDIAEHLIREYGAALRSVPAFTGRRRPARPKRILLTADAASLLAQACARTGAGANDVLEYLVTVHGTELKRFGVAV